MHKACDGLLRALEEEERDGSVSDETKFQKISIVEKDCSSTTQTSIEQETSQTISETQHGKFPCFGDQANAINN
jgi:hypothetical protein